MQKGKEILSQRENSAKVFIIRAFLAIIISIIVFLFTRHLNDYALFSLILLIPFAVISIDQVIISASNISIKKHQLFGWLVKAHNIDIAKIRSISIKEDLTELDHPIDVEDTVDYIAPTHTIVSNKVEIQYQDGDAEKTIFIKLKEKEYNLVLELLNKVI